MAYLFLSFAYNLNEARKNEKEFYNQSLIEQFDLIQKRIPLIRQTRTFRQFIENCFPTNLNKKYYISCPNFLREKKSSKSGKLQYLDNVVIRPELTSLMKNCLPDEQNIILIGKIVEGARQKTFDVKGIQLIDASMESSYDKVIQAAACNSFEDKIWSSWINSEETVFTPDFIADLIKNYYTVPYPEEIRKTYEDWNKYIEFRNYYLTEQSKRNFKLDNAEFVNTYAVNKKEYRKNSSSYEDYLLPGWKIVQYDEMVVLSEKTEEAEEFPLIRLDIERNKKSFNEAKIIKWGRPVNEEEIKIRSLASDNVFITSKNPSECLFNELLAFGYALGDRFKIVSYDILPTEHLSWLDEEYNANIKESYKNIDQQYERIINEEAGNAVKAYEKDLNIDLDKKYKAKKKELDDLLDNDVEINNDRDIVSLINKEKEKIKHNLKSNQKLKNETGKEYNLRINNLIEKEYSKIDIKSYYIKRNNVKLEKYAETLRDEISKESARFKIKKQGELHNKYRNEIRNEKDKIKEQFDVKLKADKETIIEEETIIRFSLYFRLGDANNIITSKQKEIIRKCQYIVYDNRAEKAKIGRQELALNNFYSGYVKNPYLSTYLFNSQELNNIKTETSDWMWHLKSLNERQKEAVRKAVSSNGIFLLQGPPGTGKTQVIAETIAHMVKKGKKVLISSETHKAIDNVFERMPKIPEIVPVRLIPSSNNKSNDNEYDPRYLVDNFYFNISDNMKKSVARYQNFEENKEKFEDTYKKLILLKTKTEKSQSRIDAVNKQIKIYENKAKEINGKISVLKDEMDNVRMEADILRRTFRYISNDIFRVDEDVKLDMISDYADEIKQLLGDEEYAEIDLSMLIKNINKIKISEAAQELSCINPQSVATILEIKKKEIKARMNACKNEFDDVLPEKKEEYENLKKELISIKHQETSPKAKLELEGIFNYAYLVDNVPQILDKLKLLKDKLTELKSVYINSINKDISIKENEQENIDNQISGYKSQIRSINNDIIEIQEKKEVKELRENKYRLESGLAKFFKDFEILEPYIDIDDALLIIKRKLEELKTDFDAKKEENKEKIPIYKKIANYISSKDVIEEDRKLFTKDLFANANVFGITCTSNDKFSGKTVDALSEYNIDNVDIKSVGIDVVIIDEVSKSSFIDLLIPILYGKTIILVGDHRQLPPMYEFARLRSDDFEGLDENIINKEINKKFTDLYEECFFKTLFEKIPDCYKTMLTQQYRCHEQIMNVFNHFYQGELKLGWPGQNNNKKHNIKLFSNGRNIIEPDKHIYFVDCKQNETHEAYSTSMYNTGEAKVVAELLKKLNDYFKQNPEREKLSIGVICTYGDQARKIKDIIKSEKIKTNAFKTDTERMIVSTVDDFQGDERDIIILSTVRNPENPSRSNPGFILAYQRINVSLSRARRLLIVVGNRKYLEEKGVIDLPDVYGRSGMDRHNFRVYEEIIATIERHGKVIDDVDVLEDKENTING